MSSAGRVPRSGPGDVYTDTLALAKQLIACRSLTPADDGALDLIERRLTAAGFACERIDRGGVRNLWARHGAGAPLVCLAGHVDVVPPGPVERWTTDPFTATERGGKLFGRGAADMKTSVASMVTAAERFVATMPQHHGSLALQTRGERIDACILGEPTSTKQLGDTIKNGRRGSLNGVLTVSGVQCHIAYPERGRNPIHMALPALAELAGTVWDTGNEYFSPTSFQIAHVLASAGANNTIPGTLEVWFNFRFSTEWTADRLKARVEQVLRAHKVDYELGWQLSGAPFFSPRGGLVDVISSAVRSATDLTPELSTSGGTSDGRFLSAISKEIVEFGPVSASIHQIDEHVRLADIGPLSAVYERTIAGLLTR
jgi:succinyl-diaminopimelate desuccinylase